MAKVPTPEESGRTILAIFGHFNIRPNEMLQFASLYPTFLRHGARASDFRPGVDWLVEQGYIEVRSDKWPPNAFFLTQDGFEQIP